MTSSSAGRESVTPGRRVTSLPGRRWLLPEWAGRRAASRRGRTDVLLRSGDHSGQGGLHETRSGSVEVRAWWAVRKGSGYFGALCRREVAEIGWPQSWTEAAGGAESLRQREERSLWDSGRSGVSETGAESLRQREERSLWDSGRSGVSETAGGAECLRQREERSLWDRSGVSETAGGAESLRQREERSLWDSGRSGVSETGAESLRQREERSLWDSGRSGVSETAGGAESLRQREERSLWDSGRSGVSETAGGAESLRQREERSVWDSGRSGVSETAGGAESLRQREERSLWDRSGVSETAGGAESLRQREERSLWDSGRSGVSETAGGAESLRQREERSLWDRSGVSETAGGAESLRQERSLWDSGRSGVCPWPGEMESAVCRTAGRRSGLWSAPLTSLLLLLPLCRTVTSGENRTVCLRALSLTEGLSLVVFHYIVICIPPCLSWYPYTVHKVGNSRSQGLCRGAWPGYRWQRHRTPPEVTPLTYSFHCTLRTHYMRSGWKKLGKILSAVRHLKVGHRFNIVPYDSLPVNIFKYTLYFPGTELFLSVRPSVSVSDIWEKDVGKDIEIGPSAKGWSSVTLTCRSDVFKVTLEFPESFRGVVYTRGNYGEESPCMSDPEGETSVQMTLPNTVCNVIQVSCLWWMLFVIRGAFSFFIRDVLPLTTGSNAQIPAFQHHGNSILHL